MRTELITFTNLKFFTTIVMGVRTVILSITTRDENVDVNNIALEFDEFCSGTRKVWSVIQNIVMLGMYHRTLMRQLHHDSSQSNPATDSVSMRSRITSVGCSEVFQRDYTGRMFSRVADTNGIEG
ncbi:hypothetical protein B5X24_HaOG205518 [Helicoverpa armigera]|nr:hypothetical protein B5X24_HaOG205518 [Helicoverpa armigera]